MEKPNFKMPLDDLRLEGQDLLFKILFTSVMFSLLATVSFFVLSDMDMEQKFATFTLSFISQLMLLIALFIVKFVITNVRVQGIVITILMFGSYLYFVWFYFFDDIAGLVIAIALVFMIATQALTDYRIPITFGASGILLSIALLLFTHNETFTIGIGYIVTLLMLLAFGMYASYRYIYLIKSYQQRLISQLSRLVESEERNAMLHQSSREIMWDYNISTGVRTFIHAPFNEDGDFLSESKKIHEWVNDLHPDDAELMMRDFLAVHSGAIDYFEREFRQISKKNKTTWYSAKVVSLKNGQGQVERMAGSYTDINDKKLKELRIEHLAFYDELTALPNRSCFVKDFDNEIVTHHTLQIAAGKPDDLIAILYYIDLQNFKEFNSSYGHAQGDKLILAIANRMRSHFMHDSLYQLTSVDFGLLHYGPITGISKLADEIIQVFAPPFVIDGREIFISVMMGISVYPSSALDAESLLRNADTALYYCQKQQQTPYMIYDMAMTDTVLHRISLNKHMRQALERKEFYLVYQPVVNIKVNPPVLHGFEALVRWNSPQLGYVYPDHFIPYAEETGLILDIGRLVIEQATAFLNILNQHHPHLTVSINLSAKQIGSDLFLPELDQIVQQANIIPTNLTLEITESSIIESFEGAQHKINYLREKGYSISLDDFGTGYSSLNYLGQLAIDTLKIDKSFTAKIDFDGSDYYLIKSMISLAKDLDIHFVAEGVETLEQLTKLMSIGCPLIQGYYFSKPLVEADALAFSNLALPQIPLLSINPIDQAN